MFQLALEHQLPSLYSTPLTWNLTNVNTDDKHYSSYYCSGLSCLKSFSIHNTETESIPINIFDCWWSLWQSFILYTQKCSLHVYIWLGLPLSSICDDMQIPTTSHRCKVRHDVSRTLPTSMECFPDLLDCSWEWVSLLSWTSSLCGMSC